MMDNSKIMTTKFIWQKPYVGPFNRKLAEDLVSDLKGVSNPDVNAIYDATLRKRRNTQQFDVYIKTDKLSPTHSSTTTERSL